MILTPLMPDGLGRDSETKNLNISIHMIEVSINITFIPWSTETAIVIKSSF